MSPSPQVGRSSPNPYGQRRLPPTRQQRRTGARIGVGLVLLALLVVFLLDHYGVLH